jgi:hypothetical protein
MIIQATCGGSRFKLSVKAEDALVALPSSPGHEFRLCGVQADFGTAYWVFGEWCEDVDGWAMATDNILVFPMEQIGLVYQVIDTALDLLIRASEAV